MAATVQQASHAVVLRRGAVEVEVALRPFELTVRRGKRAVRELRFHVADGVVHDQFIQLTEGVIAYEDLGDPVSAVLATPADGLGEGEAATFDVTLADGSGASLSVALDAPERVTLRFATERPSLRLAASWRAHRKEHLTGLGCRHGLEFDQRGRRVQLGADRRYTGPDCPPDMLDVGGIPQGDYVPVPFLLSSRRWAAYLETYGNGTRFDLGPERIEVSSRAGAGDLVLHLLLDRTPFGRLRHYLRMTGFPVVLPEWGYGHWKSRDVYEHQRDAEEDYDGYREHEIALDAIVLDSPWATHYNSWEFNPHQFPDAQGMIDRWRATGVRTVVWVTPWVNVESIDGQRPPDPISEQWSREPSPNYDAGYEHYLRGADGEPYVARWWMGTGSPVDFSSPAAERWWRAQAERVLRMGVAGIKADDGEGYYFPDDVRFADGGSGADSAWKVTAAYARSMQAALDAVHPGEGVLFARSGWAGSQAIGCIWGGDQASDFWSLRCLVAATLTAAATGFSNWSHDVGGYLGERLIERCPKELLLRWAQFGAFTPLMQAHGRFQQEAWTYDAETLAIYRDTVLLHERLVPYIRAAAATAARCGLPIVRPLALTEPRDARGWEIADAYGFGPAFWVAPVLEHAAREREAELPRGRWIDFWTGERVAGGDEVTVDAPLDRIPAWVREGAIVVTYPAEHVADGIADTPEAERPLHATLYGEPRGGRALARLADGTRIGWSARDGWRLPPGRTVTVERFGD